MKKVEYLINVYFVNKNVLLNSKYVAYFYSYYIYYCKSINMLTYFNNKFNEQYWCLFNKSKFDLSILSFLIIGNLSYNINISISIIDRNKNYFWNWWSISSSKDINYNFIK